MNSLTTMKGLVWKPTSSHIESTRASAFQSYSIYYIPRLFWIPINSIWQLITINLVFDFFNQTAKVPIWCDFRKLNRYNQTANRSWYKYSRVYEALHIVAVKPLYSEMTFILQTVKTQVTVQAKPLMAGNPLCLEFKWRNDSMKTSNSSKSCVLF